MLLSNLLLTPTSYYKGSLPVSGTRSVLSCFLSTNKGYSLSTKKVASTKVSVLMPSLPAGFAGQFGNIPIAEKERLFHYLTTFRLIFFYSLKMKE